MVEMMPIGRVHCERVEAIDDDWGPVESMIELDTERFDEEVLFGLADFSHVEVVYHFDQVDESKLNLGSRHPRGNKEWPRVGIFAQRAKARPNRIGVTVCEILEVSGTRLRVRGLDAIDGTPVLDLKPFMQEFAPRSEVRQPEWTHALMKDYW